MVFYGVDFWNHELPVRTLLESLFRMSPEREAEYAERVIFTDDVDEIVNFLARREPSQAQLDEHWQALSGKGARD
ncbi:hypothetical protein D3C78_1821710 [compost metagenome]